MTEVLQALFAPILFTFILCLVASSVMYAILLVVRIVRQAVEWVKGFFK